MCGLLRYKSFCLFRLLHELGSWHYHVFFMCLLGGIEMTYFLAHMKLGCGRLSFCLNKFCASLNYLCDENGSCFLSSAITITFLLLVGV